jgi:hydrogenase maturation protein HypF
MQRIAIDVRGIVQGVGFRPFVYRLATRLSLTGIVQNSARGVQIEIQGTSDNIELFLNQLQSQPPPLAQIISVKSSEIPQKESSEFSIIKSQAISDRKTLISPDIATCHDCLDEFNSSDNRRYHYPFTNCTNCGPRYTIIKDIPYDRPFTTMSTFNMCPDCQKEYDDPGDRRFHAQPNACAVCGPQLILIKDGIEQNVDQVQNTIESLLSGNIAAIKGLGGFHLAVDATNEEAVRQLRLRKHRFEKPLALMVKDIESAQKIVEIDETRRKVLLSLQRPIILCPRKQDSSIAPSVSLDNDWLGIMLPYSPLHELLFLDDSLKYLVMTSANISEEPICYKNQECLNRMEEIADLYLIHDRDIHIRCDDSVQQVFGSEPVFLRRSRGYAPRPVLLKENGTSVLAVGAHLKNTICITRENFAFVSQHIGDLENLETLAVFKQTIEHIQRLNQINPSAVIHDLHPEYLSTKWVLENYTENVYAIQHHYAHTLSVMAEYGISEPIIGVSLDGTGFGTDDTIWGGEILICDTDTFTRKAHLEYHLMPGADRAIKEPWRMAAGYILADEDLGFDTCIKLFPDREKDLKIIAQMIAKNINSPATSSCGRLFDAVAAVLGIREQVNYEGQAAILLESQARKVDERSQIKIGDIEFIEDDQTFILSSKSLIRNIISEKLSASRIDQLSRAFHTALVAGLFKSVIKINEESKINKVALSGGCFQNMILLTELKDKLEHAGFQVYINREVPANDGGISLGQAYWGMRNCR